MRRFIIIGHLYHPALTPEQITNAKETLSNTLSTFGTFEEIKKLVEDKELPFVEVDGDVLPDIDYGTIFSFDTNTRRYFVTFIYDRQNPDGRPFIELYKEFQEERYR